MEELARNLEVLLARDRDLAQRIDRCVPGSEIEALTARTGAPTIRISGRPEALWQRPAENFGIDASAWACCLPDTLPGQVARIESLVERVSSDQSWKPAEAELKAAVVGLVEDLETGDPSRLADRTDHGLLLSLDRFHDICQQISA